LGQEFGAYAQAVSRDRWRLYNAEERLRSVNLGGTAIGNSINADRQYVLTVTNELKKITGLPIAKAEDLLDVTQNLDVFVEVHGLVKAGACSAIKICNDLRLLSSGPNGGFGEITLLPMQAGSSIMPGKVNPVIPESTIQISELVKGHDIIISNIASAGNLELNSFSPLLAHLFLKSLKLLNDTIVVLADKCIIGIKANEKRCRENLLRSSAIAVLLINRFGYDRIAGLVKQSVEENLHFFEIVRSQNLLSDAELNNMISDSTGVEN
jgi:aspartate ammonia-lyase